MGASREKLLKEIIDECFESYCDNFDYTRRMVTGAYLKQFKKRLTIYFNRPDDAPIVSPAYKEAMCKAFEKEADNSTVFHPKEFVKIMQPHVDEYKKSRQYYLSLAFPEDKTPEGGLLPSIESLIDLIKKCEKEPQLSVKEIETLESWKALLIPDNFPDVSNLKGLQDRVRDILIRNQDCLPKKQVIAQAGVLAAPAAPGVSIILNNNLFPPKGEIKAIDKKTDLSEVDSAQKILHQELIKHIRANSSFIEIAGLLEKIKDINKVREEKTSFTPLMLACLLPDERLVLALLKKGANPNIRTTITIKQDEDKLLHKNKNCFYALKIGSTPLIILARHGEEKYEDIKNIVSNLLEYNSNINAQDEHGDTVLHWAAWMNNTELVKQLLSYSSIDLSVKNSNMHTPIAQQKYRSKDFAHKTELSQFDKRVQLIETLLREAEAARRQQINNPRKK
jgi:hypothetical protein